PPIQQSSTATPPPPPHLPASIPTESIPPSRRAAPRATPKSRAASTSRSPTKTRTSSSATRRSPGTRLSPRAPSPNPSPTPCPSSPSPATNGQNATRRKTPNSLFSPSFLRVFVVHPPYPVANEARLIGDDPVDAEADEVARLGRVV